MRKLFLDDLRTIEMVYDKTLQDDFDIVRSYDEFVNYIRTHGLPDFISFDNDLGLDINGEVAQMDMPLQNGLSMNQDWT